MKIAIKLPGAGMIKLGISRSPIPWLAYRDYNIDAGFYTNLFNLIKNTDNVERCALVSGGVGAHLQMNLGYDLGLDSETLKISGVESIRSLQNLLLAYAKKIGCLIHPSQLSLDNLEEVANEVNDKIFFINPDIRIRSTDSLAVIAAEKISADILIFFKAKTPFFSAGFSKETKMIKWPVDDFIERASEFEKLNFGNYVLDSLSLSAIKKSGMKTFLVSPENYMYLFDIANCPESTEIVL